MNSYEPRLTTGYREARLKKFSYLKQKKGKLIRHESARANGPCYVSKTYFAFQWENEFYSFHEYVERRGTSETWMIQKFAGERFVNYNCIKFFPSSPGWTDHPHSTVPRDLSIEWFKGFDGRQTPYYRCVVQIRNFIVDKFFFPPSIDRSIQNWNNLINARAIARNDSLALRFAPGVTLCRPSPPFLSLSFLFFPPKR